MLDVGAFCAAGCLARSPTEVFTRHTVLSGAPTLEALVAMLLSKDRQHARAWSTFALSRLLQCKSCKDSVVSYMLSRHGIVQSCASMLCSNWRPLRGAVAAVLSQLARGSGSSESRGSVSSRLAVEVLEGASDCNEALVALARIRRASKVTP